MKKVLIFIMIIAGLVTTLDLSASAKKRKKQERAKQEQRVKDAIRNWSYKIDVSRMHTSLGDKYLSYNYSLEVNKAEVKSALPYYGRAYSIPYGGGVGLNFTSTITDYEVTEGKRGSFQIKFKSKSIDDLYQFKVEISKSGICHISVSSNNRQSISFQGSLAFEKELSEKSQKR